MIEPFAAYGNGQTVKIAASDTSASGVLPITSADVRVYNATAVVAFIRFSGAANPEATTSDIPIPPGGVEVFSANGAKYVAVILDSDTGDVYFTAGRGI